MSGEIVKREANVLAAAQIMGEADFDRVWRMAKALAQSRMFKDVTQAEQAFARILLGVDLGLSPTQALMNIDVVEGNARVRSTLLAAWVRKSEAYDYAVQEHDDQHCVIEFFYNGEPEGKSAFSLADAERAGLIKPDKPRSAWMAHPRNMLWARAMSNGVRWYCPDLTGGIPVYTEADSFDSTAVEIGEGEGDGTPPPWDGVSDEHVAKVEELMARAEAAGFPALSDSGTIRMRLNGQAPEAVAEWIAAAEEQVLAVEAKAEPKDGA